MRLDELLSAPPARRVAMAVAAPEEPEVIAAVMEGAERGFVRPILVGDPPRIAEAAAMAGVSLHGAQVERAPRGDGAAARAAELVSTGDAEVLMKGLVETAPFLKAVLNPEYNLRTGALLSHVAFFQIAGFDRMILVTDAAMNIAPDLHGKRAILQNAVSVLHALGYAEPRVAVLAAKESVNQRMAATVDAARLTEENREGTLLGCCVDGPLALDNAVSAEAARTKGITSPVAGHADILVVPTIEAGNILYKALAFMTSAVHAGVIAGARVPVVLTSRADHREAKLNSIIVAARSITERSIAERRSP